MKILIDEDKCIGCGTCENICSKCFKMEGSLAVVIKSDCDDCDVEEVAQSCPVDAIKIEK